MADDPTAAEAFSLLADDTRIDVLTAVAEAQSERDGAEAGPAVLRFSELYDRVDVDGTSKLSYHLGELTGTFLRKQDEGYAFTHAGERLVRFVLSGNYGEPERFDSVAVDGTCLHCGVDALRASIDDQFFFVRCGECERPVTAYHVSPAQTRDAAGEEIVERIVDRQTAELELARRGTCPECAGRLSITVEAVPPEAGFDALDYVAIGECTACMRRVSSPLPLWVAYHPAAVAFHWEAGVDVTASGGWELVGHLRTDHWTAERTATDPAEFEVVHLRGADELRLCLDATATVTSTERVRHRGLAGEET